MPLPLAPLAVFALGAGVVTPITVIVRRGGKRVEIDAALGCLRARRV